MKADIDENGCLKITAETGLEAFALKVWHEDCTSGRLAHYDYESFKKATTIRCK